MSKTEKECSNCGEIKDLNQFHRARKERDGRRSQCGACLNAKSKEVRDELKEKNILIVKAKTEIKTIKTPVLVIPKGEILCEKNGSIIAETSCLQGCNDACRTCKSIQTTNLRAINNLSPEEEKEGKYSVTYRSSAAIAVEDGYRDI